jgi:hypothetical protein
MFLGRKRDKRFWNDPRAGTWREVYQQSGFCQYTGEGRQKWTFLPVGISKKVPAKPVTFLQELRRVDSVTSLAKANRRMTMC